MFRSIVILVVLICAGSILAQGQIIQHNTNSQPVKVKLHLPKFNFKSNSPQAGFVFTQSTLSAANVAAIGSPAMPQLPANTNTTLFGSPTTLSPQQNILNNIVNQFLNRQYLFNQQFMIGYRFKL